MELDEKYWDNRYKQGTSSWDIGAPSAPIKEYINQLENKNIRILIPGSGSAHEADYLVVQGFTNITVLDFAAEIVARLKTRFAEDEQVSIVHGDFFEHQATYDLVLEQTFFCALPRELRANYYKKMYELLSPKGKIAGVMFGIEFEKQGPPFGGSAQEYKELMQNHFVAKTIALCYNSIPPRAGNELFVILERK